MFLFHKKILSWWRVFIKVKFDFQNNIGKSNRKVMKYYCFSPLLSGLSDTAAEYSFCIRSRSVGSTDPVRCACSSC